MKSVANSNPSKRKLQEIPTQKTDKALDPYGEMYWRIHAVKSVLATFREMAGDGRGTITLDAESVRSSLMFCEDGLKEALEFSKQL